MPLKELIATDKDRLAAKDDTISRLRELLRDIYDVAANGHTISAGLLDRIRGQMDHGRHRR